VHARVDTEAEPRLAAKLGIRSIPSIVAFRDGVLVYSHAGAMPPVVLDNLIAQVEARDMKAVRARIAARKAAAAW